MAEKMPSVSSFVKGVAMVMYNIGLSPINYTTGSAKRFYICSYHTFARVLCLLISLYASEKAVQQNLLCFQHPSKRHHWLCDL